jgi:hypothetical protein
VSDTTTGKYAPVPGNIPGIPINLGGRLMVLAPLGLRLAREMADKGKAVQEGTEDEQISLGVEMVYESLRRNYVDITMDEVRELIDSANVREASEAIAGISGLKRVTPGEIQRQGQ